MSRVRAKHFDSMQFFSVDGGKSTASEETQVLIRDVLTKKKAAVLLDFVQIIF